MSHQSCGHVLRREEHVREHAAADEELAEELVAPRDALRVLGFDLQVVVEIADDAVAGGDGGRRQTKTLREVAPEDRREEDARAG